VDGDGGSRLPAMNAQRSCDMRARCESSTGCLATQRGKAGTRRVRADRRGRLAGEQALQQVHGALLIERLVPVPTLGGLNATRAAFLAGAFPNEVKRPLPEVVDELPAALG